jgi:hypothetical protein
MDRFTSGLNDYSKSRAERFTMGRYGLDDYEEITDATFPGF